MLKSYLKQHGVSLIEAMIVVALIVILLVLSVPLGREWLLNQRIRTAAESMLAGLQLARAEAVRRNDIVEFVLSDPTRSGWEIRTTAGEQIQQRSAGEGTGDVTVSVLPSGAEKVSFDGLGRRRANADGSQSIERIALDLPETVLAPDKTRDLRIQIGVGGQILLCDPNVTDTTDVRRCP